MRSILRSKEGTAASSMGQTSIMHGMNHVLEVPLTEAKCRCMGELWSQGLHEVVCSVELTGWCWVWLGKSSDNMNYSGPLGQGNGPTHRWKPQEGEAYTLP